MRTVTIKSDDAFVKLTDYTEGQCPLAVAHVMFDAMLALSFCTETVVDVFQEVAEECDPRPATSTACTWESKNS